MPDPNLFSIENHLLCFGKYQIYVWQPISQAQITLNSLKFLEFPTILYMKIYFSVVVKAMT